jgi:HAD superfamily hydrolase (TIGR01509 family)
VFDVDGLLIDTEPLWARAEEALLARRGLPFTEEDRRRTVGRSIDATIRDYADRMGLSPSADAPLRRELMSLVGPMYRAEASPMPGAIEIVERLGRRMPLAAATNTDRHLVEGALRRAGLLGAFTALVTAGDVARPKPAPDVYLEACARLGVAPPEAVGFEDSASGMAAARAAGLWCIAVPDGPHVIVDDADLVVSSLTDLIPSLSHSI